MKSINENVAARIQAIVLYFRFTSFSVRWDEWKISSIITFFTIIQLDERSERFDFLRWRMAFVLSTLSVRPRTEKYSLGSCCKSRSPSLDRIADRHSTGKWKRRYLVRNSGCRLGKRYRFSDRRKCSSDGRHLHVAITGLARTTYVLQSWSRFVITNFIFDTNNKSPLILNIFLWLLKKKRFFDLK